MTTLNPIKLIATLTATLVGLLALLAFILSYSSLQHLAVSNGIPGWLSHLWPLLLDFAMIVFSLAILRANLRREPNRYPWLLTIAFASLATLANVLDVASLGLPPVAIAAAVKALAPVALVLAFELLMSMLKAEINRAAVVTSLAELVRQREQLTGDVAALEIKTAKLQADLAALKTEKRRAYTDITDETRAAAADILAERSAITGAELGRLLGRSPSTGRRLKRELQPQPSLNGHHKGGQQ